MANQTPIINGERTQGHSAAFAASVSPLLNPASTYQALPNGGASVDSSILYLSLLKQQQQSRRPSAPEVNPASVATLASSPAIDHPTQSNSTITTVPPSRRRKPNFAEKLHSMLSRQEYRHVVTWLPSGRSFVILNQEEFARRILPRHFREAKFESFSRRLKRWGFKKDYANASQRSVSQTIVVSHDLFHRDHPDLCRMMDGRDKVKRGSQTQEEDDQALPGPAASGLVPGAGLCPALLQEQFRGFVALRATEEQRQQLQQQASFQEQMAAMHRQMGQQGACLVQSHAAPQALYSQPPVDKAGVAMVARSMAQASYSRVVNPQADPRAIQLARIQLNRLNDDIANCNEQLAILQRMKELRERRRQLTIGASSPRTISPSSLSNF